MISFTDKSFAPELIDNRTEIAYLQARFGRSRLSGYESVAAGPAGLAIFEAPLRTVRQQMQAIMYVNSSPEGLLRCFYTWFAGSATHDLHRMRCRG